MKATCLLRRRSAPSRAGFRLLSALTAAAQLVLFLALAPPAAAHDFGDLSAQALSGSRILLRWEYLGAPATRYALERKALPSTTFVTVKENIGPHRDFWIDKDLEPGVNYRYRIRAFYGANPASAFHYTGRKTRLPPVTDLVVLPDSPTQLRISWNHEGVNVDHFELYRAPLGTSAYVPVDPQVPPGLRQYVDTHLAPGQAFIYRMRAMKGPGFDSETRRRRGRVFEAPAALLDVFEPGEAPFSGGTSTFSTDLGFSPSGSAWATNWGEEYVFLARLQHVEENRPSRSWDLRLGKGGQIYSLRSTFGEALPPQWRPANENTENFPYGEDFAPWLDEVFQFTIRDLDIHGEAPNERSEVHQAGAYLTDWLMTEPFYSPVLAVAEGEAERAFTMVSWPQEARVPVEFTSDVILYQRVRDVGKGVVEISSVAYNFGDKTYDSLANPWGGSRRTNLPFFAMSHPDGGTNEHVKPEISNADYGITEVGTTGRRSELNETGGWGAFATDESLSSRALGIVFGHDETPLPAHQPTPARFHFVYTGGNPGQTETDWRNYLVAVTKRRLTLPPHSLVATRYYFVVGTLNVVNALVKQQGLVDRAQQRCYQILPAEAGLLAWYEDTVENLVTVDPQPGETPVLTLYDRPVIGSLPVFYVATASGEQYATTDPYSFSNGVRPYDGQTHYVGLLGYSTDPLHQQLLGE